MIAIVAGEASGDTLGADLICSLKKQHPNAVFEGIGGPKMIAEGFNSLFAMDRLSVMGLIEPLKRLPELLSMRNAIIKRYKANPPAVFIGIDSPDFNAKIEQKLNTKGIKTVHYVSPSVWAWRQGRIKNIKRSVDLMLALFPFEVSFYQQHQVPVKYVGHPLAKQFANRPKTAIARQTLGLDSDKLTLCIMPGSRASEVELMTELFLDSAEQVAASLDTELQLVIPAANQSRYLQLQKITANRSDNIRLLKQQSHLAMEAADVVLLTSGTTALEAMLLKKPMVVGYRMGSLSYALMSPLIKTPYVAIPNLLADKLLVPELIQSHATTEALSKQVVMAFQSDNKALLEEFDRFHQQLAVNSGEIAATAIADLLADR